MTKLTQKTSKVNYRQIYESCHGSIPKDDFGRTYEIHHIDGNQNNNDPSNLQALTIQEHYSIHHAQGDWGACYAIARRMKKSPEELSELSKQHNQKMLKEGTHPFSGGDLQRKRLEQGTHHFQGSQGSVMARERNARLIAKGVFVAQQPEHAERVRKRNEDMLKTGTHPSQVQKRCDICGKLCSIGMHKRWHGDNCKLINLSASQHASEVQKKVLEKEPNLHFSALGNQLKIKQGKHSSQNILECPHCHIHASKSNIVRWHLNNCQVKITGDTLQLSCDALLAELASAYHSPPQSCAAPES